MVQLYYHPITMEPLQETPTLKPEPGEGVEMLANDEIRSLMQTIQSLRHLGIEARDLPFPKLCVTGDQSTGKSSLIEGISEIKVPRGSGTCTRCPVEINLTEDPSPNAEWCCEVSLSQKYSYAPSHQNRATRNKPLGPWIEKELETFSFASLRTKDAVGQALEWAQLATLNPSADYKLYKPGVNNSTSRSLQVPFSPNVVRLDISGPGLLNLSFYDLPGIVSQDQHNYVPRLVENLVKEYICAENCIVLHTLTMNHDVANSIAARIILESNADDRTIGVLTKPDLFGSESVEQWAKILNGTDFPRKLGYYVVKNNAKITVDHATARMEEKVFFENMAPFSTELQCHSHRFGTWRLQTALSMMLATQIKASLPNLIKEIGLKLTATEEKINKMPKPPDGNVAGAVQSRIDEFVHKISNEIDGGSLECDTFFFTKWHDLVKKFSDLLVCSRPLILRPNELIPSPPRDTGEDSPTPARCVGSVEAMVISDDEEDTTPKRSKLLSTPQSGQKRQNRGDPVHATPQKPTLNARLRKRRGFVEAQQYNKRFTIAEIRDKLRKLDTGAGSVGHPKVVEKMFQDSIAHWGGLNEDFLEKMRILCKNHLLHWIQKSFGCWAQTKLYDEIRRATANFLEGALAKEHEYLEATYGKEMRKLLVLDTEEDAWHEQEILNELQATSREWQKDFQIKTMARQGYQLKEVDKENIAERIRSQPDPYFAELRALAKVRSHYHSSATQYARSAALSICTDLFESLRDSLHYEIRHAIGLDREDANDICKQLLAVDPAIEQERQRLLRDQKALQEGHNQLSALLQPLSFAESSGLCSDNTHAELAVQERDEGSSQGQWRDAQSTARPRPAPPSFARYSGEQSQGSDSFLHASPLTHRRNGHKNETENILTGNDLYTGNMRFSGNGS